MSETSNLESKLSELEGKIRKNEKLVNQLRVQSISAREKQVIRLISNGYTSKEIAKELGISVLTTDTHRKKIMKKLKMKNLALLVAFAIENGLN